jgi:hypothetical protein
MATLTHDQQANAKQADLAGPGIGNYTELEQVLPNDYRSLLDRRDTQKPFSRSNGISKTTFAKPST